MKLKLMGASALALALAFLGVSAASAQTAIPIHQYTILVTDIDGTEFCLPAVPHGDTASLTSDIGDCSAINFLGPYHITGDSTNWWEVQMSNGMCLNDDPLGVDEGVVYSDSCVPDLNEWWDNHYSGKLINAEQNSVSTYETYLQPSLSGAAPTSLIVYTTPFSGWQEIVVTS